MVQGELTSMQLAITDELTGISNRRGFEMLAQKALAVCQRSGQAASVAVIDLDGLKAINDEMGHHEGDAAIKAFGELLVETFRDSDVVARVGGDEFYAFFSGTDEAQSDVAIARLTECVEAFNERGHTNFALRYSSGIAACSDETAFDLRRALQEADARMYAQKRSKPDRAVRS